MLFTYKQWLAKCRRPARQDKQARVCSLHFKKDDYDNFLQYDSGFASKLILKPDAVPSVFGEPDVPVEEVAASAGPYERSKPCLFMANSVKFENDSFCSYFVITLTFNFSVRR